MSFDPRQSSPVGIVAVFVTILGILGAILVGQMVANNEFTKIGLIATSGMALMVVLGMGKKIWLLIPLCWLLTGKIGVLPLPATVRDMSVLAAFGVFIALIAFKKLTKIARLNCYDFLLFLNLIYLVTVYVRNPVGTQALGSDMVGGRPYIDAGIAVLAYWVLQHVELTKKEIRFMPILMSIGALVVSSLGILTQRFTGLVPIIAPFYSGVEVGSYLQNVRGEGESGGGRIGSLMAYGNTVGLAMVSFFKPISLLLPSRPVMCLLFYSSMVAVLLSGFRNGVAYFGAITLLASYFHAGLKDVVKFGILGMMGLLVIILLHLSGVPVHPAAQRALSFIPAGWDPEIVRVAEGSSEWRFEMWKIALESDKYIRNKLLGDGFGYSSYELQIQLSAAFGGQGYINANDTESQLVTGAFHSGPISAVRYVGVLGLVLFTILLLSLAKYAWQIITEAKGTYIFPLALFVGLPAIYKPLEYWFVFGGFDSDLPKAIFSVAMLNLTHRALRTAKQNRSEIQESGPSSPLSDKSSPA